MMPTYGYGVSPKFVETQLNNREALRESRDQAKADPGDLYTPGQPGSLPFGPEQFQAMRAMAYPNADFRLHLGS